MDIEKEKKLLYMKNVHTAVLSLAKQSDILKESGVEKIEVNRQGEVAISLGKEFENIKLGIYPNDYEGVPVSVLCFGNYEREETNMVCELLKSYKKEAFVVFDVGANVGWYTLNIRKKYPNMKVYSFEPCPLTYQRLKKNLELNKESTDRVYNIGLYKEDGEMDFYYDSEASGASSLLNIREKDTINKIKVKMVKMDYWAEDAGVDKVDFIKCDVEGSEFFVYQGGKELIKKNKPIIFSEMLRKWSAKFNYTPNDIISFMKELGYGCYVIAGDRLKECPVVTEETIETNYFFLHLQKHIDLINQFVL